MSDLNGKVLYSRGTGGSVNSLAWDGQTEHQVWKIITILLLMMMLLMLMMMMMLLMLMLVILINADDA